MGDVVAMRCKLLECAGCGGLFSEDGRSFDLGDRLVSDFALLGFTCRSCERSIDRVGRRLRNSGLPASFARLGFDSLERDPQRAPAIALAEAWAAGDEAGLLLFGPVGAGKTRLAATAARRFIDRRPLTWVSVPVLIQKALAAFDSDERRDAAAALTGTGPLVLDDLDKVKASDWVLSQLFVAIDSRVNAGAGLLVTTNLGPAEIRDQLGEPIASRLAGYCAIRRLDGRDRRLIQGSA